MDLDKLILGAIGGDIIGSPFEFHPIKTKDFELFSDKSHITDDSVMTMANMQWLTHSSLTISRSMKELALLHKNAGYGPMFGAWLEEKLSDFYGSFGNGSAMRVSPIGWYSHDMPDVLYNQTLISAAITHNHREGIRGAMVVTHSIAMALNGNSKEEIKRKVIELAGYNLNFKLDDIRESYKFDSTCQGSVPQAFMCFMEADSYEDAVRNAVSLGGDADTMACIAGSIAEAFYGIPHEIKEEIWKRVPDDLKYIVRQFSYQYHRLEEIRNI